MFLMVHSTAYFVFDTIGEYLAGTDDLLTNLHHVCVVGMSVWHLMARTSGFEYLVLHLMAETSNPFIIIRTMLKIRGQKDTKLYRINEIIFAVVFLFVRMLLTPLVLIYLFEADHVIYGSKFGIAFVLYVQLFWCYRVLFMTAQAIYDAVPNSKCAEMFLYVSKQLCYNKTVRMVLAGVNFFLIFIVAHYYYGFVRKSLFVWMT